MSLLEGKVGEQTALGNGTEMPLRIGTGAEVIVGQLHGRYAEAASHNRLFVASCATVITGVQAAAAHISPVAATAATLLSLHNPLNSGFELSIIRVSGSFISSTVEIGSYVWNLHPAANVTAAMSAATIQSLSTPAASPAGSCAKAYSGEAITGGTAGILGPMIGSFAVALTQQIEQDVGGMIRLKQGGMATIAAPTAGTAAFTSWSIVFEQIPV